jgi:hypothetical protein
MRDAAGAWVLGALDDDEAGRFAAHLEVCALCRDEVEQLRIAVDALPLAAPQVSPPPELKARLMAVVDSEARERRGGAEGAERPRRPSPLVAWLRGLAARPSLAAAAAVLLLVAGGAIGYALRGGGGERLSARVIPMKVDAARLRGASASIVETAGGLEVRVRNMPAPPPGRVYQVWLQHDGRAPSPDAVFTVDRAGRGAGGVLGAAQGADAVLVTDEPPGGSRAPSRPPVLTGRLA